MVVMRVLGDGTPYTFEFDGDYPADGIAIRGPVPCWWALGLIGGCQG